MRWFRFVFSFCLVKRFYYYRLQRSCGQGYVFTRVCDSVHRGWWGVEGSPGRPPGQGEPPWDQADTPRDQADTPRTGRTARDQADTPGTRQTPPTGRTPPGPGRHPSGPGIPPRGEDCSIRSMSGRYASYWNAFLYFTLISFFLLV